MRWDHRIVINSEFNARKKRFRCDRQRAGLGEALRVAVPEPKEFKFADVPYPPAVAYSPDGRTVLAATGDNTAQLWDALTGKTRGEALRHADLVYGAAFSPDGKVLLTASGSSRQGDRGRLWNVATSKPFCRVAAAALSLKLAAAVQESQPPMSAFASPMRGPPAHVALAALQAVSRLFMSAKRSAGFLAKQRRTMS
jgi:hypothetical protein